MQSKREFDDLNAAHLAKLRAKYPDSTPSHFHAMSLVLSVAHELALSASGVAPFPDAERLSKLGKRLMGAREEASLAHGYGQPPAPVIVRPAPRSACLRCGAPYETTEPAGAGSGETDN